MTLANEVVCETSLINIAFNNFSISTMIITNHSWPWRLFFYYIGLILRSIASLWQVILESIPGISVTIQVKHSWYFFNSSTNFCLKSSSMFLLILIVLWLKSSNSFIFLISDSFASLGFLSTSLSHGSKDWVVIIRQSSSFAFGVLLNSP